MEYKYKNIIDLERKIGDLIADKIPFNVRYELDDKVYYFYNYIVEVEES